MFKCSKLIFIPEPGLEKNYLMFYSYFYMKENMNYEIFDLKKEFTLFTNFPKDES